MTDEKKLTDADLEKAQGAGPGISSQKNTGRGGRVAGGGTSKLTSGGPGSAESLEERSAYPENEEPK